MSVSLNSNFKPLVSIIIPCYNGEKYLTEAINSALNQTYSPIEVIVVNDGSRDKSEKIARKYGEKIKVITHKNNRGLNHARNTGLNQANGEYIQFLDSDDLIKSDKIEKQLEVFDNNSEYDVVFSEVKEFYGKNIHLCKNELWRVHKDRSDYLEGFLICNTIAIHAPLIRKNSIDKINGFSKELNKGAEDYDFWIRLCLEGRKFKFLPGLMAFYRKHTKTMTKKQFACIRESPVLLRVIDYMREFKGQTERHWHILSFSLARQGIEWAKLGKKEMLIKMIKASDDIRPEIKEDIENISSPTSFSAYEKISNLSSLYLELSVVLRMKKNIEIADKLRIISDCYYKSRSTNCNSENISLRLNALFYEALTYYKNNEKKLADKSYKEALDLMKLLQSSGDIYGFWGGYALYLNEMNLLDKYPDVQEKAILECSNSRDCFYLLLKLNLVDKYPDILDKAIHEFRQSRGILLYRAKNYFKRGKFFYCFKDILSCIRMTCERM